VRRSRQGPKIARCEQFLVEVFLGIPQRRKAVDVPFRSRKARRQNIETFSMSAELCQAWSCGNALL
jgi:hypothetical protein